MNTTPTTEHAETRLFQVVGAVPPGLAHQLQSVPAPQVPELARLPRPGERDPITGSSRSWLIDTNAGLPAAERFLFRVKQRGKMRGAVFVNVSKLMALMRKAESASTETEETVAAIA